MWVRGGAPAVWTRVDGCNDERVVEDGESEESQRIVNLRVYHLR